MRITICAVGRLKPGPERALVDDYLSRLDRTGKPLALGPARVVELDERKVATRTAQSAAIQKTLSPGTLTVALDERGVSWTSRDLAEKVAHWRDHGQSELAFLIGGADGLDPELRNKAEVNLSLGAMVWPHMLARVMLAEQLYRATTILAGTPYHRE
ncbi:MAG: 23S rRNA (pseudouridine(1915)-N(3))-methyltransferase RlmH [Pseudomonadota bacterium]